MTWMWLPKSSCADLIEIENIKHDVQESEKQSKINESYKKDQQKMFNRLRSTGDFIEEIIETNDNKTSSENHIEDQLKSLAESTDSLSKQLNEIQDELFQSDTLIRKHHRQNTTQSHVK